MDGIFTDTRSSKFQLNMLGFGPAGPYNGQWDASGSGNSMSQTTTSFRTNRELVTEEELANATKVTQNGFRAAASDYDSGNEFYSKKDQCFFSHKNELVTNPTGPYFYQGPLVPSSGRDLETYPPYVGKMSQNDINFFGTQAIASTRPLKPVANLTNFLGEFVLDGLPKTIGDLSSVFTRAQFFRSLGDQYLNVAFGWTPFIKDLSKLLKAVSTSYKVLEQTRRDSGRIVRRRHDWEPVTEHLKVEEPFRNGFLASFPRDDFMDYRYPPAMTYLTQSLHTEMWFTGAYTYFLAADSNVFSRFERFDQLANALIGSRITPETLWQLAPWSWLVDWKLNVGDLLSNIAAFSNDDLVLKYGYLMRKTTATSTLSASFQLKSGLSDPVSVRRISVQKERYRATPHGFGLDPASFSAAQAAIVVSLGLARNNGLRLH